MSPMRRKASGSLSAGAQVGRKSMHGLHAWTHGMHERTVHFLLMCPCLLVQVEADPGSAFKLVPMSSDSAGQVQSYAEVR